MPNTLRTHVRINKNSHTAAMCETDKPCLCPKHLEEVTNDGDLLEVYRTNQYVSCNMCQAELAIGEN